MAVRFDAAGDALSRSTSPPNVRAFTVCGWAYALVDSGANPQPIFAMLDAGFTDGVILYWDNIFNETSITVANGGAVFDATVIATSPATGTPFFWFASCAGNGTNAITAGIRTASANTLTTAQADMDAAIADNTAIYFADIASSQSFNGRLWNIKAWDRALSLEEVLIESFYERMQFPASRNFHWQMYRHDALFDISGNGRNPTTGGTLTTEDGEYGLWTAEPLQIFVPAAVAATLEQEGFRWGNDDGSESAHTHAAAQDANVTAPASQALLLNWLVDITGDPGATTLKVQVALDGTDDWSDIPVQ